MAVSAVSGRPKPKLLLELLQLGTAPAGTLGWGATGATVEETLL
jgi:hypothetical protein